MKNLARSYRLFRWPTLEHDCWFLAHLRLVELQGLHLAMKTKYNTLMGNKSEKTTGVICELLVTEFLFFDNIHILNLVLLKVKPSKSNKRF